MTIHPNSPAITLAQSLRCPVPALRAVAAGTAVSYQAWAWLVLIAVGGSCAYGTSVALVHPGWSPASGGLTVTLAAGLAWCVFGPALVLLTRRSVRTCAHACLVTMAYGEGVLFLGAVANLLLSVTGGPHPHAAVVMNGLCVVLANGVMASLLAVQLRAVGVRIHITLLAWGVVLNGTGALALWLLGGRL